MASVVRAKAQRRHELQPAETVAVQAACLTVATSMGNLMDSLCIVGGFVPVLLIDRSPDAECASESHPGTQDLDLALDVGLLDVSQYTEISARLRREGFVQDVNDNDNPTVQRWTFGPLKVTIDFLMAPVPGADPGIRIHKLEGDFGVVVTPGIDLAFDERVWVEMEGQTLKGERAARRIPVCGPGAFVVLKALAFHDRTEPKDAFDLVYVLRRWPGGVANIIERLGTHVSKAPEMVRTALRKLQDDFASVDHIGPRRAAAFELPPGVELDEVPDAIADAFGFVDDLLSGCRKSGLC